jgi:transcription initiation factor IIE alpha subunit
MKNLIIALSVFFTAITSLSAQTATKKEVQKTMYVCPMHPNEVSTKEGRCSKCEMKMVKTLVSKHDPSIKGSQTKTKVVKKYVCTMDGATSNKPGKCPKCGMNMKEMNDQKMEENHKH